MHIEGVATISRCAECEAHWLPADEERWRAYLGSDTGSMSRPRSSSTARTALSASSRT